MRSAVLFLLCAVAACTPPNGKPDPPDPVISALETRRGPAGGGNVLAVVGEHLTPNPFITLGANNVDEIVLATATRVEFVAPAAGVGPAHLTLVREDGGRATLLDAYFYVPPNPVWYQAQWFDGAEDQADANPIALTLAETVTGIDIEIRKGIGGSMTGVVTDPTGTPAPETGVWLQRIDGMVFPVATISDLDGVFEIGNLPPGDWRVYTETNPTLATADVLHPGVIATGDADAVTVTINNETAGVTLPLRDGATITGSVTGSTGPIASTSVFATMVSNSFAFGNAQTSGDGTFEIRGLAGGDYTMIAFGQIAAHATEYYEDAFVVSDATPVSVIPGAPATVDFALSPGGSITGNVLETTTLAVLSGLQIVAEETTTGAILTGFTDSQGDFTVSPLPPGTWRLSIPNIGQYYNGIDLSDPGSATLISVAAGEEVSAINFVGRMGWNPACPDPTTTAIFTGVVQTDQGIPLDKTRVEVVDDATGIVFPRPATVATDGTWTIDCVPPGTYRVVATPAGTSFVRQQFPTTVTVAAMDTASALDFSLSLGGRLSGRVNDAETHAPVSGVLVTVTHVQSGFTGTTSAQLDGTWTLSRLSTGGLPDGTYVVFVRDHITNPFTPAIYY